jgi:hypothetical protein
MKDLSNAYGDLKTKVMQGTSPQQRLGYFTAGVAGLIESHLKEPDDVRGIAQELRTNGQVWNDAIFANA